MMGLHHDISVARYHADPAPEPSLSSSIARVLLEQSPRHAWLLHPRLNPEPQEESDPTRAKEIGTATHKLILGKGVEIVVIDADDFKKEGARKERAAAYEAGQAPILKGDLATAEAITSAVAAQLSQIEGCAGFAGAPSEVVAIAHDETGAWLRAMFDKLEERDGHAIIWDVKTTGQSAAPQSIGRKIADMGYEVQSALYERVLTRLRPDLAGRIIFRWVFVEVDAPHLVTVAELDNTGLEIGRKKIAAAIHLWNQCRAANNWPGYPARVVIAEYPPYAERQWLDREMNDEALAQMGIDPFLMRAPWMPPRKTTPMLTEIAS